MGFEIWWGKGSTKSFTALENPHPSRYQAGQKKQKGEGEVNANAALSTHQEHWIKHCQSSPRNFKDFPQPDEFILLAEGILLGIYLRKEWNSFLPQLLSVMLVTLFEKKKKMYRMDQRALQKRKKMIQAMTKKTQEWKIGHFSVVKMCKRRKADMILGRSQPPPEVLFAPKMGCQPCSWAFQVCTCSITETPSNNRHGHVLNPIMLGGGGRGEIWGLIAFIS